MTVKFTIGSYQVSINSSLDQSTFDVVKNGIEIFTGETKKVATKMRSCFERNKPDYTLASVCLEYALDKVNK